MESLSSPKDSAEGGLVDIHSKDHRVKIMHYVFGETVWENFIRDFVKEILINRSEGFIRLVVKHYDDPEFSWVFRKKDVCPIGVVDGQGHVFELGTHDDGETRYLKHSKLTNYGNKYRDLLIGGTIVGTTLSAKFFEEAQMMVCKNVGQPEKWRHSFGITSLMISEPARFVGYRDVLTEKFDDGTDLFLAGEGDGPYDWLAYIPDKWFEFSECAMRFVSPEPVLYDPQTMFGAYECLLNPTAAHNALLVPCLSFDLGDEEASIEKNETQVQKRPSKKLCQRSSDNAQWEDQQLL